MEHIYWPVCICRRMGGDGIKKVNRYFSQLLVSFIRVYENLVQHPSNNISNTALLFHGQANYFFGGSIFFRGRCCLGHFLKSKYFLFWFLTGLKKLKSSENLKVKYCVLFVWHYYFDVAPHFHVL